MEVRVLDEGTWLTASVIDVTGAEVVLATATELPPACAVSIVVRDAHGEHIVDGLTSEPSARGVRVMLRDVPDAVRAELERRARTACGTSAGCASVA